MSVTVICENCVSKLPEDVLHCVIDEDKEIIESDGSNRTMKIVNKKFEIPADALDYFYHCKYFSPNSNVYVKLTKETPWFPKDIPQAKLMAKSWTTSLKERNKIFAKCVINIMFDFNVRAISFQLQSK
jgi:hypothetical protein